MSEGHEQEIWLTESFRLIETAPDVEAAILGIRDTLAVDHLVYHSSRVGLSPAIEPYIRLTYPAAWVKRYLQMGYVNVDPVLREGFLRTLPFDWSELTVSSAAEAKMLGDALAHGVGPHGLSIPVRNKRGHRALFSVSSSGPVEQWNRFRTNSLSGLIEIGYRLHKRVVEEELGESAPHLTPRELECLFWISEGKEASDIAVILNLSTYTVRDYLKSARYKLDSVNSTQAVSVAVKLGLLPIR